MKRMQQRAIPPAVAELIWQYGENIDLPGGVQGLRIPKHLIQDWERDLRRIMRLYDKSRKVLLVMDESRSTRITAYSTHKT